jgi:glycosyltransferase involved in cell wall biosynthesis
MPPKIAYFINQYPKVSHSFVRREIQALESLGFAVERFALRGWDAELVDPSDLAERTKTTFVLQRGIAGLLLATIRAMVADPLRFGAGLALALKMGRRADRPMPFHLVYLAEACQLLQWIRQRQVRHMHAHFGTNSTEIIALANAMGGPGFSFTVHGPEEFDKPEFIALGEKIRRSAFVVAISSYGRSQLFRWTEHTQWPKVKVVHCGLEEDFHTGPASAPPDVARLVCIGRLCEQKGQLLLLEAMAQVVKSGVPMELVLAGDGEMRSEVEALVQRHGLGGSVRITGWISSDQVRAELLAARAMVLPSFAEGLPVVIMEAMALRRPVLTTFVAGIPELVQDEQTGWLFAAGSVDALAAAMIRCLQAPVPQLAAMGDAAHQRVLDRHSIATEASKLAQHFNHAMEAVSP